VGRASVFFERFYRVDRARSRALFAAAQTVSAATDAVRNHAAAAHDGDGDLDVLSRALLATRLSGVVRTVPAR
jgi:hypothetical protein